jgi:hypothetical protein
MKLHSPKPWFSPYSLCALEEMLGGPRGNKSLGMLLNGHAITDQTRAKEAVKDTKVPR